MKGFSVQTFKKFLSEYGETGATKGFKINVALRDNSK